MLDQLFKIFSSTHHLAATGERFSEMWRLVDGMIQTASAAYWGSHLTPEERTALQQTDIAVNELQRRIRKEVITHLSASQAADAPYGLLLMSLVKDAERLGDYAKNLAEVHGLCDRGPGDLPVGPLRDELRRIADFVERLSREAPLAYAAADTSAARQLSRDGKQMSRDCDSLIRDVAASDCGAALAVDMVLATRYYKRIIGHSLNLLSSVLMPLHKLDYIDRDPGSR